MQKAHSQMSKCSQNIRIEHDNTYKILKLILRAFPFSNALYENIKIYSVVNVFVHFQELLRLIHHGSNSPNHGKRLFYHSREPLQFTFSPILAIFQFKCINLLYHISIKIAI